MEKLTLEEPVNSKATLSDKLKGGISSLFSIFKKKDTGIKFKNSEEALGEIYKLMVERDSERKEEQSEEHKHLKEKDSRNEKRNQELIKALKGLAKPKRKPRPKKRVEEKKTEPPKKQEPTKPAETKPAETKPVETKPAETKPKPAETKPATKPEPVKPAEVKPEPKVEPVKPAEPVRPRVRAISEPILPPVGKAVVATAGLGAAASAIGGAESGGNYDITFGDSLDKKGKVVRGKNMSPEQRFNGRTLTDLTLAEVNTLGKERNAASPSTSAMGKYQFMNSVLFGSKDKKGNFRPGLVQELGLDMEKTKFTPEIQDRLYKLLHEKDVATLKRLGVPVTPGYEYMAHYLGAGGAKAIFDRRNTDMTVQQALIDAKLPDPVHGKTNAELATLKASDFESVLASRLSKHGLSSPHATGGQKLEQTSKESQELNMKADMNANGNKTTVNNIQTNVNTPPQKTPQQDKVDDRPVILKKGQ